MATKHEGRRLRRPKFSTVIALFALFAVLGGSAYAASKINGKDIKKNTVTSKAIKNGTLKTKDLSSKAQSDLQGAKGPKGDTGPQGEPGANGVVQPLSAEKANQILPDGVVQENVVSVDVQAGTSYVVNAKLIAAAGTADRIDCDLLRGATVIDEARTEYTADFLDSMQALQAVATGNGTTISITCEAIDGGATGQDVKLTAIPVG
jgi:hypothetical protein